MPNKLSQFWQELKRRNVLRTLAVYTGTAFIILEAADILFSRWGLPDWTFNLVHYLLILGMIITIILSWIFDLSPKGIERTRPIKEGAFRKTCIVIFRLHPRKSRNLIHLLWH
jgi:hypothetical protein